MATILNNPSAVKQVDKPGMIDFIDIMPAEPFALQASKVTEYRKDARRILDAESGTFNKRGINALIAALIIETRGFDYYGEGNY